MWEEEEAKEKKRERKQTNELAVKRGKVGGAILNCESMAEPVRSAVLWFVE